MKKVLILTAATGGGHNQVCGTLKEELEGHELIVETLDFLSDLNRVIYLLSIRGYELLYKRLPRLYGLLYKLSDNRFVNRFTTSIIKLFLKGRFLEYYNEHQPDVIVTVHPLALELVGTLKRQGQIDKPFIAVVTDFIPHASHISKDVDLYITGSAYTKKLLVKRGIDASIIQPLGIPIKKDFLEYTMYERKGETLNILIMGGADGARYIKKVVRYILFRNKKNKINIRVICGNNKTLKKRLDRLYSNKTNIEIIGYTKEIKRYMNECDLIISKPGAITSTEAYSQKVPILIPYYIPGHEKANADYLEKSGIAKKATRMIKLTRIISNLAKNQDLVKEMKHNLPKDSVTYHTDEIVEKIIEAS